MRALEVKEGSGWVVERPSGLSVGVSRHLRERETSTEAKERGGCVCRTENGSWESESLHHREQERGRSGDYIIPSDCLYSNVSESKMCLDARCVLVRTTLDHGSQKGKHREGV